MKRAKLHLITQQPVVMQPVVQADEPLLERCPYHGTAYTRDCPVCWQLSWNWYDEHIAPHRVLQVPAADQSPKPHRNKRRRSADEVNCLDQPLRIGIIDL